MNTISSLSNDALIFSISILVKKEREVIADVLRHLHEIDSRRLYLELGYSSLFSYCREALGYSEGAAFRRIRAARCVSENPVVAEKLEKGELSLCAVTELARVPAEKRDALIPMSEGKSKAEVKAIVDQELPGTIALKEKVIVRTIEAPLVPQEKMYTVVLQLTEKEYRTLEEVQSITSERVQSRAVVKALTFYRKTRSPVERERRRAARKARKAVAATVTATAKVNADVVNVTRHIPVEVRDRVSLRDEGRCSFIGKDGHRCSETHALQVDHVQPYSIGGEHTEENLRLICPQHNRFAYRRFAERSGCSGMKFVSNQTG